MPEILALGKLRQEDCDLESDNNKIYLKKKTRIREKIANLCICVLGCWDIFAWIASVDPHEGEVEQLSETTLSVLRDFHFCLFLPFPRVLVFISIFAFMHIGILLICLSVHHRVPSEAQRGPRIPWK